MDSLSISIDQLVGNRLGSYQIEQLLGHGSVNAVYQARSARQQSVMLTAFILPQEYSFQTRELFRERFTRVASALTKLDHPHVLPVYDFGEQLGYPYIVTPLVTTGSLAKILKQQSHLSPTQILQILPQIAEGLDYAHSQGVVHGTLKHTNILLDNEQKVQIAGFGLFNILEIRDIEQLSHPYAHLFSIARTFLGSPEYIAPEVVQGATLDARADLYALGAMLFELLSGKPPFTGSDPLAIALQRVQQPVPSLLAHTSGLPPALDLVIHRALEPDPAQRYQSASKLANAFERVLTLIDAAQTAVSTPMPRINSKSPFPQPTLSPEPDGITKNVLRVQQPDKTGIEIGGSIARSWQQPAVTDQMPAVKTSPSPEPSFLPLSQTAANAGQEKLDSPREMAVDPFVWWSTTSVAAVQKPSADQQKTGISEPIADTLLSPYAKQQRPDMSPFSADTMYNAADQTVIMGQSQSLQRAIPTRSLDGKQQSSIDKGRRRTIALLAAGGVVAVGALGIGGISLANKLQSIKQPTGGAAQANATTPPGPTRAASPTAASKPSPTAGRKPTSTSSTAQSGAAPTPTAAPPTPTPTPKPGHTGTVVGSASQGTNTSTTFSNPADGNKSL